MENGRQSHSSNGEGQLTVGVPVQGPLDNGKEIHERVRAISAPRLESARIKQLRDRLPVNPSLELQVFWGIYKVIS